VTGLLLFKLLRAESLLSCIDKKFVQGETDGVYANNVDEIASASLVESSPSILFHDFVKGMRDRPVSIGIIHGKQADSYHF
jgi:hypothetical protein